MLVGIISEAHGFDNTDMKSHITQFVFRGKDATEEVSSYFQLVSLIPANGDT